MLEFIKVSVGMLGGIIWEMRECPPTEPVHIEKCDPVIHYPVQDPCLPEDYEPPCSPIVDPPCIIYCFPTWEI